MPIVWITLPFILAFACYGEIRERRIPNWLTLGAIALGLGAAAIEGGGDDTCIAGGLIAVAMMAWKGMLLTTLANVFRIIFGMPRRSQGLRNPPMVPYALAITIGTLVAVFVQEL